MERYIIKPSTNFYGGIKIKKDTKFEEKTDNGEVVQSFEKGVLTTKIYKKHEHNGIKSIEKTTITQRLPIGTILIWGKEEGYIIPPYQMCTIEELADTFNMIKE